MFCPKCQFSVSPQDRQCPTCMHPLTSSSPQNLSPITPSGNSSSLSIVRRLAPANFLEGVIIERIDHQPEKYYIGRVERIARVIFTVELILITFFIIIPLVVHFLIVATILLIVFILMLSLFLPLPKLQGNGCFLGGILMFTIYTLLKRAWDLLRDLWCSRSTVEVREYRISPVNNAVPFDGFFVKGKLAPRTLVPGDMVRIWVSKQHGRPIFRRGEVLINGRISSLHVVEERHAVILWTVRAVVLTVFFIWVFFPYIIDYFSFWLQNYGGAT